MPFSSQPRKKGVQRPGGAQAASKSDACAHSANPKTCPQCLRTLKQEIAALQEKIIDQLKKDPRGVEKAVFVLTSWISGKHKR
jgi:hypothetical protein